MVFLTIEAAIALIGTMQGWKYSYRIAMMGGGATGFVMVMTGGIAYELVQRRQVKSIKPRSYLDEIRRRRDGNWHTRLLRRIWATMGRPSRT